MKIAKKIASMKPSPTIGISSLAQEMKRKGIFETGIFIEPRAIGYPLLMDVKVKLKNVSENERNSLIDYLMKHKNVVELLAVMGDYDFTCVLIAKDSNDLEEISTKIRQKFKELIMEWKGILILKTYKFEKYDLI